MKKYFLFLFIFLFLNKAYSQNFYFPSSLFSDSVALKKNIPALASQVIHQFTQTDSSQDFQKIIELQIIAKDYKRAAISLEEFLAVPGMDTNRISSLNFFYRPFIIAGEKSNSDKGFGELYEKTLSDMYSTLPDDVITLYSRFLQNDMSELKKITDDQIKKIGQSYIGDSISYPKALELCGGYSSFFIYNELFKAGNKLTDSALNAFTIDDSTLIKMPDGGLISATIIRKKDITEKQPVVMMYNIYAGQDRVLAMEAAQHGYAGVVVNTRGKRLSPDPINPFEKDADDAWYIQDWISKQPWCNGKIGMYGGSYLGFSQWAATKKLHPALKTIVPMVSVGIGIDYPALNGIYMSYMLRWIHYVTNNKMTDLNDFQDNTKWNELYEKWYRSGRSFRSLDSLDGKPNAIFQRWLQHPTYDSYWQKMTPQKEEFSKINIPILTITGYYDDDQLGAFHYYNEHQKWNPAAKDNHYLLIGPYDHYGSQGYPKKKLLNYTIDSVANIPIMDLVYQWFDFVLKDSTSPEFLKDKINFQVMGKNVWRNVPSLQKTSNDTLSFYLTKGNIAGKYRLDPSQPLKRNYILQTVDMKERDALKFEDDVLAGVSRILDTIVRNSKDEMIFVSDPLTETVEINGSVMADIFASVNKKDMDLVMYLYVQEPDGKFFYLNRTLQRASMWKDPAKRQLLVPGKTENIKMAHTFFTSKLVNKGSRIIITLGINKTPAWQVNYGSGKDVSDETMADAGDSMQIKWYNISRIKIPIYRF